APMEARLCLRMGSRCFRELARTAAIEFDDDPRPDASVAMTLEEFTEGWERVISVGFPVERDLEETWRHFRGWRVNYERPALALAYGVDAVPAVWSGRRRVGDERLRPVMPPNRSPDNPDGVRPKT
ncbi:MAG TPA: hypothetical protein VGS21_01930, partial [Acidimicrobiales bacterium]|nr:hypothetical protein [Acidimicrobiales bacterium]